MKKVIFTASLLLIFLITVGFLLAEKEKKPIVAACPTLHYLLEELESSQKADVIMTDSTAESLRLIEKGAVDLIISGRALKEREPRLISEKIGAGYDFIFREEVVVLEEEMRFIPFYTDLNLEKIMEDFRHISESNLNKIEEPRKYLEKGIVITTLDDGFLIGETVHVLEAGGSRVRLSRLPRIYYDEGISANKIKNLTNFLNDID